MNGRQSKAFRRWYAENANILTVVGIGYRRAKWMWKQEVRG